MNKPLISIIATFHNNEKTAKRLIKSVFSQSYTNWELICIDDCSPQNDYEIINKFRCERMLAIRNQHNLGANPSRKIGIDYARGEYITFIDGDDWLEKDAIKKMVDTALKHNTDLVLMNSYRRYPLGFKKKLNNYTTKFNNPILYNDIINNYYISFFGVNLINVAYWGKLIRTDIVRRSKFEYNNLSIGEDLLFNAYYFPMLKSMVFIDYYGYNWRFGGFTSSNKTIEQNRKIILNFIELYRIKSSLADKFNFQKAYKPMAIELKNVLLSNISTIAKYAEDNSKSRPIKELISEIISNDDFYHSISYLLSNERYSNDLFIKAIYEKNITTIYNICHSNYRSNWKKRIIKNILHKIQNKII